MEFCNFYNASDQLFIQHSFVIVFKNDDISFIVNTTEDKQAIADSYTIRRNALQHKVSYTTTIAGARATMLALKIRDSTDVNRLQDLHQELQGITAI